MNESVKIERGGVPMPTTRTQWPLSDMNVGDSFTFDFESHGSVAGVIRRFSQRTDCKFALRRVGDGYRCWRVQ